MIGPDVLEFEDLQRMSGYSRLGDVERWANENGIAFKRRRGGIITTVTAFNAAMGIGAAPANDGQYPAEIIAG